MKIISIQKSLVTILFVSIIVVSAANGQNNKKSDATRKNNNSTKTEKVQDIKNQDAIISNTQSVSTKVNQTIDYKIISSDSKGIELEYVPVYDNDINAINTSSDVSHPGAPEVSYRSFPIFLPSENGNSIEIIDIQYEDVYNVDIQPVPRLKRGKESITEFEYLRDDKVYQQNKFYPEKSTNLEYSGIFREKYLGNLKVYPIIYNPVSKSVKKIKYLRVKINFVSSPQMMKTALSKEEKSFLRNLTLNWKVSMNWSVDKKPGYSAPAPFNSALSSGDFYKIEIKETGMYKVDKATLQSIGIDVNSINPATIRIFNYGGFPHPFNNSTPAPDDMNEVKIFVSTDASGKFDYLLFYGTGTKDWLYNKFQTKYDFRNNIYSNSNFYWITFNGINGSRMPILNSQNNSSAVILSSFTDNIFNKAEVLNPGSTGTLWVSQKIGYNESFVFTNNLPGYIPDSYIKLKWEIGNSSGATATFELKDDNASNLYKLYTISGANFENFSNFSPYEINESYYLNPGATSSILRLKLPSLYNYNSVQGNYDYFELHYNRALSSVQNNSMRIFAPDTNEFPDGSTLEFNVSPFNTGSVKVFDITDYSNIKIINPISYNNGVVKFQDNISASNPKQYMTVGDNAYKSPVSISAKVPNQNLHNISDGASFVIISPAEFIPAANRLKAYRETEGPNKLKTMIVDVNLIYNEFSNGMLDPLAIRNFLKFAYNNWTERPVYVLFLGDGSYDYKNIYNVSISNWLPPMERPDPSSNTIASYPCDDFISNIFDNYENPQPVVPSFSIGRLCINSLSEANTCIDKIIEYESPSNNGNWKTHNMYVADDGWTPYANDGSDHTRQSEDIAELFTPKIYEKQKIYIAAYQTVMTGAGRRKPQANIDIIDGWNEGRLVINYVGHGSTDLWAHEHIFVREESIPQLHNKGKYPFVTIASCDLSRWDDLFNISAGEQIVFIPDKGAIADIAASRPVYSGSNAHLNNILWSNFMFDKDSANAPTRIGKAFFITKAQLGGINDNDAKYLLIGDPTLRIEIPQYFTRIDSINNTSGNDTAHIKALQKVKISGSILNPDSTLWNTFNGNIYIKVFDVNKFISFYDYGALFAYTLDGGIIFSGKANITNGKWTTEFVVPKDISYQVGLGKIQAYFSDNTNEGAGYTNMFSLNGIDTTAVQDTTGPKISLFVDSRNFRSGDIVNQNTKIIADLYDENGINLTGTIGHKIEGIINNDVSKTIDLTNYYSSTEGYQNGTLEYPLLGLADGNYNIKLKVWDTYNNFNESSVDFIVKNNGSFSVSEIYNYPNPFSDKTSFLFQHNFDSPVSTDIKIYTVSGRLIKELQMNNISEKNVFINWDGRDADNDVIANGVYLYKVLIKTDDGQYSNSSVHKLVKLK